MKGLWRVITGTLWGAVGASIATVSAILIAILAIIDMAGSLHNPYVGILSFLVLPALFVFGLVLIPFGYLSARKRQTRRLPVLDLNRDDVRLRVMLLTILTVVNVVIVAAATEKKEGGPGEDGSDEPAGKD